jgi:phospholipid transport system substrate-binding protein
MAEYALGRAWKKATDEQRQELMAAFEEEIITAYLGRMRPEGTKLEYVGQRPPVEGHPLAASRRTTPGKPDETWIWELRPDGKSWRIVDLYVDGHSALSTERQEYGSVFDANKGDVDAVIAFMRDRASKPTESK